MQNSISAGHLSSLLLVGFAGLVCCWMLQRSRAAMNDSLERFLRTTSIVLMLLGTYGVLWLMMGPLASIGWTCVVFVTMLVVSRLRRSEERRLIWLLAVSAERGLPLDKVADEYAQGKTDEMALRATRFAELISQGASLPLALRKVRHRPAPGVSMLMSTTPDLQRWGAAVRKEMEADDLVLRREIERAIYLPMVMIVGIGIFSLMALVLFPRIQRIWKDFNLNLPAAAKPFELVLSLTQQYSFIVFGLSLLIAALAVLLIAAQLEVLPRGFWGLGWLYAPRDSVEVLRIIGSTIKDERPIRADLEKMVSGFPNRFLRKRLAGVLTAIDQGASWSEGLRRAGILSQSDVGVFDAAQRADNLEWAMDAVCDMKLRRLGYRLRIWFNVLFPISLILLGVAILLLMLGVYLPFIHYVFTIV